MSEPIKFTEEEMKTISEMQTGYSDIQNNLGSLSIAKLRLATQIDELQSQEDGFNQKFIDLRKKESEFLAGINKKYGEGILNPETGTFVPSPEKK